jgi:hypothetical protein
VTGNIDVDKDMPDADIGIMSDIEDEAMPDAPADQPHISNPSVSPQSVAVVLLITLTNNDGR